MIVAGKSKVLSCFGSKEGLLSCPAYFVLFDLVNPSDAPSHSRIHQPQHYHRPPPPSRSDDLDHRLHRSLTSTTKTRRVSEINDNLSSGRRRSRSRVPSIEKVWKEERLVVVPRSVLRGGGERRLEREKEDQGGFQSESFNRVSLAFFALLPSRSFTDHLRRWYLIHLAEINSNHLALGLVDATLLPLDLETTGPSVLVRIIINLTLRTSLCLFLVNTTSMETSCETLRTRKLDHPAPLVLLPRRSTFRAPPHRRKPSSSSLIWMSVLVQLRFGR